RARGPGDLRTRGPWPRRAASAGRDTAANRPLDRGRSAEWTFGRVWPSPPALQPARSFDRFTGMLARPYETGVSLTHVADMLRGRRVVVLAGAGRSTEAGLPDYRRNAPEPRRASIQCQEFMRSAESRARYWARSAAGWVRFSGARPNAAHFALARLEAGGVVCGLITQNVDGLHQAAGSRAVVELHGSLAFARCVE